MIVFVGSFTRTSADGFSVVGEEAILHPKYQSTTWRAYDICLVRTKSIFEGAASFAGCAHGNCFSAACLPQVPPTHGRYCWVAGYGRTISLGPAAETLMEVGVNLFNHTYCTQKSVFKRELIDASAEFCAGVPDWDQDGLIDGGKDSCQGDSGGPLVCVENNVAVLYGLVSWGGKLCAERGKPGVYTNVFTSRQWIMNIISTS